MFIFASRSFDIDIVSVGEKIAKQLFSFGEQFRVAKYLYELIENTNSIRIRLSAAAQVLSGGRFHFTVS